MSAILATPTTAGSRIDAGGDGVSPLAQRGVLLDADHRAFCGLLEEACRRNRTGDSESAAVYAEIAAQFAWFNHAGIFASPPLEQLLSSLGRTLDGAPSGARVPSRRDGEAADGRGGLEVLHVVTQVYQTGGPTQCIAGWIEQDSGCRHRVCITRQGPLRLPDKIRRHAARGVDVARVDAWPGGLLQRARRLRHLARRADVVVLHAHPYDVVPVIAFADELRRPPLVYVNHGDHVFWVGASVADVVMNMRDSGCALCVARRGIAAERALVAPRPLALPARALSREEAKIQLGLAAHQVLVVTAADAPKYRPVAGPSLLEVVLPVFEACGNAVLLAAGPPAQGEWLRAARRTQGRVRALGRLPDVALLHQAADVYLDSFPFSSLTSLLEAGSFGTPVMTYAAHAHDCAVLGADTPGIDAFMLRPATPAALRADLLRLIRDDALRATLGANVQAAIVATHRGDGWRAAVAAIYRSARTVAAQRHNDGTTGVSRGAAGGTAEGDCSTAPRATGMLDRMVNAIMAETGYRTGVDGAIRDHLGLLRLPERLREWMRLRRAGVRVQYRALVPEAWLRSLAPVWRLARRAGLVPTGTGEASHPAAARAFRPLR